MGQVRPGFFYESDWGMNKVFSSRLELHELRVMAFDFSY